MFTVKQAAELTGLSVHTIRYYDDNGLIPSVDRDEFNQRLFSEEAIEWLCMCRTLRRAGLSLKEIKEYSDLYQYGDETLARRKAIITKRREKAVREMESLKRRIEILELKEQHYSNLLEGRPGLWKDNYFMDSIAKGKDKL